MREKQIVALTVDKVQNYLIGTIHAHVQEKQTEKETLKSIMNSSREISKDFYQSIKKEFNVIDEDRLLNCSGVFIFISVLPKADIDTKLNKLFLEYYRKSQGQKLLKYTCFSAKNFENKRVEAIQEAKKRLKYAGEFSKIIEKNKNILFSFQEIDCQNTLFEKDESDFPMFARNLDTLFNKDEKNNKNHFRIAVIKADLDGMGDMFKKIKYYEEYSNISKALNDIISMNGLHKVAENFRSECGLEWLFPFYVAGDDIFFAVSLSNIMYAVSVCRQILENIKDRLNECSIQQSLSMSIGIEITFNNQPIRYYLDMVERQLKNAKNTKIPYILEEFKYAKISFCNLTFMDVDYDRIKEQKKTITCYKNSKNNPKCRCNNCQRKRDFNSALQEVPIWQFFLSDVNMLKEIKAIYGKDSKSLGAPGFFYTLLERLTHEEIQRNRTKYINSVLYHLLPRYLDSSDKKLRELELRLNSGIMEQLYRRDLDGYKIEVDDKSKQRLETYLRLMLLFSEERFSIEENSRIKERCILTKEDIENARKILLSRPKIYLKKLLRKDRYKMTNIFINDYSYRKKGKLVECLQLLRIEKSMFFKLFQTDMFTTDKINKVANMLELQNSSDRNEINSINEEKIKEDKTPNHLYFDKSEFCKLAMDSKEWNQDYVQSMMLLYEYNKMNIKFRKYYPKKKTGGN